MGPEMPVMISTFFLCFFLFLVLTFIWIYVEYVYADARPLPTTTSDI